jgi:hypothetical protein
VIHSIYTGPFNGCIIAANNEDKKGLYGYITNTFLSNREIYFEFTAKNEGPHS